MAVLKLSQITNGGAIAPTTDQIVGVRSGTTDVLLNPGQFTILSLAASPTDAIFCQNTTPAISGTQQVSPAIEQSGQGFGGSTSQAVNFRSYVQPVQGVTNPTGNLVWQSSVNGGAYANIFAINNLLTTGGYVVTGGLNASGALWSSAVTQLSSNYALELSSTATVLNCATSGSLFLAVGNTVLTTQTATLLSSLTPFKVTIASLGTSPTDALQLYNTTAAANGAQQYSPLAHWQAQGFGTTAGTSQAIDFTVGATATQGTVPTGAWVIQGQVAGGGYNTLLSVGTGVQGITALAGVNTAGKGVPAIYASARTATQTNATATITSYANPATDGSFEVSAYVNVSAATSAAMTVTCTYTDETNTSRTATFSFVQAGVAAPLQSITNVTGASAYAGLPMRIRAKASTTVTIATAGTVTGITYIAEADIKQVA